MDFKQYIEVVELMKPTGVKKRDVIKHRGTNTAHKIIEYGFKTRLGNVVKVQFEPKGDDKYNVLFYVNDTLDDAAGKQDSLRDSEILSGAFYLIKDKADKLGAKTITFLAEKGTPRIVKNLPVKPKEDLVVQELHKFAQQLKVYPVKMTPPSPERIAIWNKFKMGTPTAIPDLDVKTLIDAAGGVLYAINSNKDALHTEIDNFISRLLHVEWKKFNIDVMPLRTAMRNLLGAIKSQTPNGWADDRNQREPIYEKLMNRHFSDKWNINKNNSFFTLTRK